VRTLVIGGAGFIDHRLVGRSVELRDSTCVGGVMAGTLVAARSSSPGVAGTPSCYGEVMTGQAADPDRSADPGA
jgi:hypothetical protein